MLMSAANMAPAAVKSSLEVMLDTIRQRDEQPKDVPPALPARPTSRGRLPSARRSLPVGFKLENGLPDGCSAEFLNGERKIEGQDSREGREVGFGNGNFGNNGIAQVDMMEESADANMMELDRSEKRTLKKENNDEASSVIAELERRVLKAELALREKEEENASLKQQLQQYERRWSEYEGKMKSMEETWQNQLNSLQLSLASAKKSFPSDEIAIHPVVLNSSPIRLHFESDPAILSKTAIPSAEALPKQASASEAQIVGNSNGPNGPHMAVGHLVRELEQKKQAFESDAGQLIAAKSGQSDVNVNPDEELRRLKVRFTAWKKDYKVRLRETKAALQKLGNHEKTRKRWWLKRSSK
ncbi:myosin-1-like [Ananas comosus]|uniref:Myosin-1-like n=1 Tax=Ananas comosus TaxID=4615 RepID=A0A6P5F114_ANACO|nr:myosin-1-like [Ananas comosus]